MARGICCWCGEEREIYSTHYGLDLCLGCADWKQELRSDALGDDDLDGEND